MVSVDELKQRFGPSKNVAPYGECIVIQGSEFDPDWEADLDDQGYRCFSIDLDAHPVVLVRLNKIVSKSGVVFTPPKIPAVVPEVQSNDVEVKETEKVEKKGLDLKNPEVIWKPEEDAFLASLWIQVPRLTAGEIAEKFAEKFPKRRISAVASRIAVLQKKGVIASRWKIKPKGAKAANNTSAIESEKSPETTAIEVGPENSSVEKRLQILSEAYDSLSKAYVDLKTELGNLTDFVQANIAVKYKMGTLQRDFIKHKHAVSGEAMLPMEAQK
jgi:hypothetical protein